MNEPLDIRSLPGAEVLEHINCSYIARRFFNRTRAWFIQRLNNNIVNGKPVSFTDAELCTLSSALRTLSNEILNYSSNLQNIENMNYLESALEEEIKIVGSYANLHLGVKLFPNGDNTFDVCAYHYAQGGWMPLGDAEDVNNFASESEAIEHGINLIKEQTKYWDWALSENCNEENTKSAVRRFLGISSQTKPKLNLFSVF